MSTRQTIGWLLDRDDRAALLERFRPRFPDVVAHHVTLDAAATPQTPLPRETEGAVIGESDDGIGVQALVVAIGGTSDRPDGSSYHITWSLDRAQGRRPAGGDAAGPDPADPFAALTMQLDLA